MIQVLKEPQTHKITATPYLLEENLYTPPSLIEFPDSAGGPLYVVGDKNHHHLISVNGEIGLQVRMAIKGNKTEVFRPKGAIYTSLGLGYNIPPTLGLKMTIHG